MNYEHAYLFEGFLHILCSDFDVALALSHHKKKKFVKIVAVCRALLDYDLFITKLEIKEATVPQISIKMEKFSSYPCSKLIYKIFILSNHRWLEKLNPFQED